MLTKEKIERINALYKKQKEEGLNDEENKEQAKLRREYVDTIKQRVKIQLGSLPHEEE